MPQHTHTQIEEWRDIPGYEGYYQVGSHGRVRSCERVIIRSNGHPQTVKSRALSASTGPLGYQSVSLCRSGKCRTFSVHKLVLLAFVGPYPDGMEARHLDGNPANNDLNNLAYGTSSENKKDTIAHGNHPELKKTHCKRGHPLIQPNLVPSMSKKGKRNCLACQRANSFVYGIPERKLKIQQFSDSYFDEIMKGNKNAA